ncbi:MAG: hypothetical protein HS113_06530 [Verrucomicrobiales bacterium]|nr:hypothetical protein [Verrucomicrobiales bacterium]
MKPESLHALLTDRELGELSPEAGELLDAWLAEHPGAAPAPDVCRLHDTVRMVFARFPELARPRPPAWRHSPCRRGWVALAWAASVAALLAGTSWVGFRLGQTSARPAATLGQREPLPAAKSAPSSWASYALVPDPRGGLNVVRRSP